MPDMTITFSPAQAQRIQAAFATPENPSPDMDDLKSWVTRKLRSMVQQHEARVAQQALPQPDPFEPT